jgi:predicted ester cyclase
MRKPQTRRNPVNHQPKTAEEQRNNTVIHELYASAEAAAKDTAKFMSFFADGGYFYDVSAGKKYYGEELGYVVDVYAEAFPDMHRELYRLYYQDDVVCVELSLNGTHEGNLPVGDGFIPPTGQVMSAPTSDVFHLKDGKVVSFHCYVAVPILLSQLGVFNNLSAAIKK